MAGVLDARGIHGVKTVNDYQRQYRQFLGRLRKQGFADRISEETVAEPIKARVDANRWLIDCYCGAGVAAHEGWPSMCFGCGRVYSNVVFPPNRSTIEGVLLTEQKFEQMREWSPPMTVEDLRAHMKRLSEIAKERRGA